MCEQKIKIVGKEVQYLVKTEWERKTLMANGFHQHELKDDIMCSSKDGAEYVANTINAGGI